MPTQLVAVVLYEQQTIQVLLAKSNLLLCCGAPAALHLFLQTFSVAQSELGLVDRVAFSSKFNYNACLQAIYGEQRYFSSVLDGDRIHM
jgi:hypothetical protein